MTKNPDPPQPDRCPRCKSDTRGKRERLPGDPADFSAHDYFCEHDWHAKVEAAQPQPEPARPTITTSSGAPPGIGPAPWDEYMRTEGYKEYESGERVEGEMRGLIELNAAQLAEVEYWADTADNRWSHAEARRVNLATFARCILKCGTVHPKVEGGMAAEQFVKQAEEHGGYDNLHELLEAYAAHKLAEREAEIARLRQCERSEEKIHSIPVRVDTWKENDTGIYIAKFSETLECGATEAEAIENLRRVLVAIGQSVARDKLNEQECEISRLRRDLELQHELAQNNGKSLAAEIGRRESAESANRRLREALQTLLDTVLETVPFPLAEAGVKEAREALNPSPAKEPQKDSHE